MVQTFEIMLRVDIHFEVRKGSIKFDNSQSKQYEFTNRSV